MRAYKVIFKKEGISYNNKKTIFNIIIHNLFIIFKIKEILLLYYSIIFYTINILTIQQSDRLKNLHACQV